MIPPSDLLIRIITIIIIIIIIMIIMIIICSGTQVIIAGNLDSAIIISSINIISISKNVLDRSKYNLSRYGVS